MVYLVSLLSLSIAVVSALLLVRLYSTTWRIGRPTTAQRCADPFGAMLAKLLDRAIDTSLLTRAASKGLADLALRYREHQDPYENLAELVNHILQTATANRFTELVQLVKALYQLQYTLDLPLADLDDCLAVLLERLQDDVFMGKPIGRVEKVSPGLLDQSTMMPLTHGTHVRQPLGTIVFARDGKVLSKAKVLCS